MLGRRNYLLPSRLSPILPYNSKTTPLSSYLPHLEELKLDSPPGQQRTFTIRPPSRQGQGMRSAVVSATGRTPLERISTNVITTGTNGGAGVYRGGSVKGGGGGGRIVYGRK